MLSPTSGEGGGGGLTKLGGGGGLRFYTLPFWGGKGKVC